MIQLSILDAIESQNRADEGLQKAVDHAGQVHPEWKERCWGLFRSWLLTKHAGFTFMTEDFRLWVELNNKIEQPPSLRAFGFLSIKALREGLIKHNGTARTTNPKAHRTPANVWRVV